MCFTDLLASGITINTLHALHINGGVVHLSSVWEKGRSKDLSDKEGYVNSENNIWDGSAAWVGTASFRL